MSKSLLKFEPASLKSKPTKESAPAVLSASNVNTEDVLNAIHPPKILDEGGNSFVLKVSSTPATRLDVVSLAESLDLKIQQRQARETGICPIREELYGQCFDEIIRQVSLNCAERGVLLIRTRNELRARIAEYQSLYESSIAFGMRKSLMAEQQKMELQSEIKIASAEVEDLEKQVSTLTARLAETIESDQKRFEQDEERHAAEVERLKKINDDLTEQLETLLSVKTN